MIHPLNMRPAHTFSSQPRPRADNVVNLMDALKRSIASEASKGKKPRKASVGQKEMLLPIEGKKPAAKKGPKARKGHRAPEGGMIGAKRHVQPRCPAHSLATRLE